MGSTLRWGVRLLPAVIASVATSPVLLGDDLGVGPIYLDDFPRVQVVVQAPTADVAPAPQPAPSDLTLLEDGRPTATADGLQPFGETGNGIAVVVALDVSGTMAGKPLDETVRALLALLEETGPQDRLALVSFADDVRVESSFEDSRERLHAAIEGLTHRGRITELYLALFKAFDQFEAGAVDLPARRRLLVISDGKDEGEAYTLDDVLARAESRGIPVDAIGLTRIDERYLTNLDRLAELSGGSFARARDASELEAIVRRGRAALAATPVATFTVSELAPDGLPHRLGVQWRRGDRVLEGEARVVLPPPPAAEADPDAATDQPGGGALAAPWWRDLRWIALATGLVGLLLALLLWRLAPRARRRAEPAAPSPAVRWTPSARSLDRSPQDSEFAAASLPSPLMADAAPGPPARSAPPEPPDTEPPPEGAPRPPRKTQFRTVFPAPAPGAPSAVLVAEDGPAAGSRFPVESSPYWIGAAENADLRLATDDYVSSHHASVQYHDGSLLLYDNRSTNGTFVNDARLDEAPRPLAPGDRVRFGRSTFTVVTS